MTRSQRINVALRSGILGALLACMATLQWEPTSGRWWAWTVLALVVVNIVREEAEEKP